MRFRKVLACMATAVVSASVLAACSSAKTGGTAAAQPTGGTPLNGGVATMAQLPGTQPNYIFPFTSSSWISVSNLNLFQYLLYRPLYWYGTGTSPTVNPGLSLANNPVFSSDGKTVTITMKDYKWSDGTPVTAQNVMFWLNMEQAVGATDYGAYNGFPNQYVKSMAATSPTTLTLTLTNPVSDTWFLYNDLSQVSPMPEAWDRTAAGPSHCSTTISDCAAVYKYLDSQSKQLSTWATSPLWQVVDGPFKLAQYNTNGFLKLVPNPSYSGPQKARISAFEELPFTEEAAEYNVLLSPNSSSKIDVGYIPQPNLQAKPAGSTVGPNPVSGYTLDPWYDWGVSYYAVNQQSNIGDHGAELKQLYLRQALAYLMNQEAVIAGPLKGYAYLTTGPVATQPVTSWLSQQAKADPFPYSPDKAKSLLTSHGWTVNPNGTDTCSDASKCGAGITAGSQLSFSMVYASGQSWIAQEMEQLQSNAAQVGIKIGLRSEPFATLTQNDAANCVVAKLSCNWDMADWGLGWSYYPDVYPTGEVLFMCGVPANASGYCDKTNDTLTTATLNSSNMTNMYTWQNNLSTQLPEEWQPNPPYQMTEVANNLRGVLPQASTLMINPENWYFVKS